MSIYIYIINKGRGRTTLGRAPPGIVGLDLCMVWTVGGSQMPIRQSLQLGSTKFLWRGQNTQ